VKFLTQLADSLRRHFLGELLVTVLESKILAMVITAVIATLLRQWLVRNWVSFLQCTVAVLVASVTYYGVKLYRERRLRARTRLETRAVMRPDADSEALATSTNLSLAVVGNAVELFVHPNLNTLKPFTRLGWAPSEVTFTIPSTGVRTFDNVLSLVGGINSSLRPPNNTKLGLATTSFISFDSDERPTFEFYRTDYFTQQSVYKVLPVKSALRRELANLDPNINQVPNATGLQSIVLFSTDAVLCMYRHRGTDAESETWSISFEEQIKEDDFTVPGVAPAEYLFRRAFIEEVFGCKDPSPAQVLDAWQVCSPLLFTYRLWGLFFEEKVSHFQLLGFYWLKISPEELASRHHDAKAQGWAGVDLEGKLFVLERDQIDRLLDDGVAEVRGLYDATVRRIRVETSNGGSDLHRTSLYRLWRLRLSLDRKPSRELSEKMTTLGLRTGWPKQSR
jgi:hypothetical protein